MSNGRLSTSNTTKIDRNQLMIEIDKFLTQPSNYEIREGRTFIVSENHMSSSFKEEGKLVTIKIVES